MKNYHSDHFLGNWDIILVVFFVPVNLLEKKFQVSWHMMMCHLVSGFPWYRNVSLLLLGLSGPWRHSSWTWKPLKKWMTCSFKIKRTTYSTVPCHIQDQNLQHVSLPVFDVVLEPEEIGITLLQNIVKYLMTQHHVQEDLNHQQCNCKNLKSCYFEVECEATVI